MCMFYVYFKVCVKPALIRCVCKRGRERVRGMVTVCHYYTTSDCQAVSQASPPFLLCPICPSSLHPPSFFPGGYRHILSESVLRLLPPALPLASIHPSMSLSSLAPFISASLTVPPPPPPPRPLFLFSFH